MFRAVTKEQSVGKIDLKALAKIAGNHGKTTTQVVLRWHIQRGIIIIPKTVHKERMAENLDIWDFELTQAEMGSTGKTPQKPSTW